MILTLPQITDILKENPNSKLIAEAAEYNKKLKTHMYGFSLSESLEIIRGFEKPEMRDLRVKYTKSTKDLFSRLARPVDKVFSARGGSVYYNLAENQEAWAREKALNVRDGYSVKKWIENFWKPHFLDDPNGFIFIEVGDNRNSKPPYLNVYPTYKSISTVFDYLPAGNKLEYVVFTMSDAEKRKAKIASDGKVFRIVDDLFDYMVKWDGTTATILQDHTYPNYFFAVPAILNSDFNDPLVDGKMISLFDECMELAKEFLLKGSIKVTHDFLHGFPRYAEYADQCTDCVGTGYKGNDPCPTCKGAGATIRTSVSDTKLLKFPESKEEAVVLPANTGAFISPDKTYHEIATSDLSLLEAAMHFTLWGKYDTPRVKQGMSNDGQKTATEVISDEQPMIDRLMQISESAETRHKFILDHVIKLTIPRFTGTTVNYGKRFQLEGPDSLWDKYSLARKDGAPVAILDDLLVDYLEAKYGSDPISLNINLKLREVEPFVHVPMNDLEKYSASPFEKLKKSMFGEWLATKQDHELFLMDVKAMRKDLETFVVEQSKQDDLNKDDTPLAVKLGVGGTQALQLILADANIDPVSKRNTLQILFGVSEEDAIRMVSEVQKESVKVDPLKSQEVAA